MNISCSREPFLGKNTFFWYALDDQNFVKKYKLDKKCLKCKEKKYIPCKDKCDVKCSKAVFTDISKLNETLKQPYQETLDENFRGQLHKFACQGDVDRGIEILQKGANPFQKTRAKRSPMFFAICSNCPHFVQLLIDWGSDVNEIFPLDEETSLSILQLAVLRAKPIIVQLLLHYGANVHHFCDDNKFTVLHWAIKHPDIEVPRLVLAHGASVSVFTREGLSPLHIAISNGIRNVVRLLVKYGADVHECILNTKIAAIHVAVVPYDETIFQILISKKVNINASAGDDRFPLLLAIRANVEIMNKLNSCTYQERKLTNTNTKLCSNLKKKNVIIELLKLGAQFHLPGVSRSAPLQIAIQEHACKHLIQNLLDYEVYVNDLELLPLKLVADSQGEFRHDVAQMLLIYGTNYQYILKSDIQLRYKKDLMMTIKRFRIARQVAGFINIVCNDIPKLQDNTNELPNFMIECTKELTEMGSKILINNFTALQLLCGKKPFLAQFVSRHRAKTLLEMMPEILNRYPIYGPMMRKNCSIGWRYAPIFKKAVNLFSNALNDKLPLVPLQIIISYLNYNETKTLIKTIHEVQCSKTKKKPSCL